MLIIRISYNIINKKVEQEMGSINVLSGIGMAFFFLKFYIFIAIKYAFNFLQHIFEKIVHGSSKTVICPYKKTHEDVFLTICKHYIDVE